MTATLGHVTRSETGAFKGQLRTLNIRADIEIVPVRDKPSPAYPGGRGETSGVGIGAGWNNVGEVKGQKYVGLNLGPSRHRPAHLQGQLGRAAGQDDDEVFALIWNPEG